MKKLFFYFGSVLLFTCFFINISCSYQWGGKVRSLPGGYNNITVPLFKNLSQEPGIEVSFTDSLISELQRSHIAQVTNQSTAQLVAEGTIVSVTYLATGTRTGGSLPLGAVLAVEYRILIVIEVTVRHLLEGKILWQGTINGERTYVAPQVTQVGLNTVNPLYNLSARRQNIDVMSKDMMNEAYDRMTGNF